MTRECKTLICRKHWLYNHAPCINSALDWDEFKEIRKKIIAQNWQCHILTHILDDPSRNNRFFHRYVILKHTDNNGVSALVENGEIRIQFSSIFSPASNSVPDLGPPKFEKRPDIVISETGI